MDYLVVIHVAEEGGYWGEIPALPGCYVQGETIEELLADAPSAIESHVDALKTDGQEIPGEQLMIATVRPETSVA